MNGLTEKDKALILGLYASYLTGRTFVAVFTLAQAAGWAGVTKDPHDPIDAPGLVDKYLAEPFMGDDKIPCIGLTHRGIIVAGMLLAQRGAP